MATLDTVEPSVAEEPPAPILAATPASAWKRDEPELHTLPSGNAAVLERPSLMEAMRREEIPEPLIEAAVAMMEGRGSPDYARTADLVAFMVASAFVEPRVRYEGELEEGEVSIEDIDDADRTYVIAWLNRETPSGAAEGASGSEVPASPERRSGEVATLGTA